MSSVCAVPLQVSAVFTHKTGVLTGARMLVAHLLLDGRVIEADTTPEQNKAEAYRNNPTFKTVLHTMALCNRSEFSDAREPNVLRRCVGDRLPRCLPPPSHLLLAFSY